MKTLATIATISLWIMIIVLLVSFFYKGQWITITWIIAGVVGLGATLIAAARKKRGGRR